MKTTHICSVGLAPLVSFCHAPGVKAAEFQMLKKQHFVECSCRVLSESTRPLMILLQVQNAFKDAYCGEALMKGRCVFLDVDSSRLTQQLEHLRSNWVG